MPADVRRLFFALWPDDGVRGQLAGLAARVAVGHGVRVAQANLHITLVFLGSADGKLAACAQSAAAGIRGRAFTLSLDCLGHWPRPQVLWLGAKHTPAALAALVQELNQGLTRCGFTPEDRPYQPHLTLARKLRRADTAQAIDPVVWRVEQFCLVQSITRAQGAEYRVLHTWPLNADA